MNRSSLTFLESHEARQLAAAWPLLKKEYWHHAIECASNSYFGGCHCRDSWAYAVWTNPKLSDDAWDSMRRLCESDICRADGTLDPIAEQFIEDAARAAAGIERMTQVGSMVVSDFGFGDGDHRSFRRSAKHLTADANRDHPTFTTDSPSADLHPMCDAELDRLMIEIRDYGAIGGDAADQMRALRAFVRRKFDAEIEKRIGGRAADQA